MKRPEPDGELKIVQIGSKLDQITQINKSSKKEHSLFVWIAADMLGINPKFMSHRLAIFFGAQQVARREET